MAVRCSSVEFDLLENVGADNASQVNVSGLLCPRTWVVDMGAEHCLMAARCSSIVSLGDDRAGVPLVGPRLPFLPRAIVADRLK